MAADVSRLLARWKAAGLIGEETASRIRAYEQEHVGSARLRWPILVAVAFGALLVGTGVLLFVSAHWDTLSPLARFTIVLLLVALFHVAAAGLTERFPAMASALHAVGTVALGAGIFLAGQIFNLDEHWPGGLMLWALGAAIGAVILEGAPQVALFAILAPAWLGSEWFVAAIERGHWSSSRVLACGVLLLALAYLTAVRGDRPDPRRRVLLWLGGIALLPSALLAASVTTSLGSSTSDVTPPSAGLQALGWTVAIGLPLAVAVGFRRTAAWPNAVAATWVLALFNIHQVGGNTSLYLWWAAGATGLVAWGVYEARRERIDLGAAIFAATVMTFYFSEVMDKLERSMSLVGLGLLFLAGGWALERVRRRLVLHTRGHV